MKSVIIIDDDPTSIGHLKRKLKDCFPQNKVTWSKNPLNTLESLSFKDADIIFLDVEMPQMSGMHFYKRIKKRGYSGRVVFTTGHSEYMLEALREHAFDFLLKPIDSDELQACMQRIEADENEHQNDLSCFEALGLTKRELSIVELLMKGLCSQEIGDLLFISKNTVDTHRRNILEKTRCKNTAELLMISNKTRY